MIRRSLAAGGALDESILRRNTERLKEIVAEIGWPGASKVGQEGALFAWLLAQHSDHDRSFQEACLQMMKEQAPGEVQPQHIALLEDRLRVNAGLPQLYGTQFQRNDDGTVTPYPVEDAAHVNERRLNMGFDETFEEYEQGLKERLDQLRTAENSQQD